MEIKRRYTPVKKIRELEREVKNLRKSIIVDFAIIMVMVIALIGMYNKIEKLENEIAPEEKPFIKKSFLLKKRKLITNYKPRE